MRLRLRTASHHFVELEPELVLQIGAAPAPMAPFMILMFNKNTIIQNGTYPYSFFFKFLCKSH
jgi:hypothetical protein